MFYNPDTIKKRSIVKEESWLDLQKAYRQQINNTKNIIKILKYGFFRRNDKEQKQILKLLKESYDSLAEYDKNLDIIKTKIDNQALPKIKSKQITPRKHQKHF